MFSVRNFIKLITEALRPVEDYVEISRLRGFSDCLRYSMASFELLSTISNQELSSAITNGETVFQVGVISIGTLTSLTEIVWYSHNDTNIDK